MDKKQMTRAEIDALKTLIYKTKQLVLYFENVLATSLFSYRGSRADIESHLGTSKSLVAKLEEELLVSTYLFTIYMDDHKNGGFETIRASSEIEVFSTKRPEISFLAGFDDKRQFAITAFLHKGAEKTLITNPTEVGIYYRVFGSY